MFKSVICLFLLISAMASAAQARHIEDWPYDRLMREADVVVIATVQSQTDSNIRPQGPLVQMKAIARITTFTVDITIKGDPGASVDLLHFRLPDGTVTMDGPLLAHFRKEGPAIQPSTRTTLDKAEVKLNRPQYLLFLKRTEAGRLEPVSGQYDPVLSIREIYMPLPAMLDDRRP